MSEMTMPPSAGKQPPESPVPAPRATNGIPSRLARPTMAATCAVSRGNTTKSASARNRVRPSDSYTSSSSGSESTPPLPTIASSSRRSACLRTASRMAMAFSDYTRALHRARLRLAAARATQQGQRGLDDGGAVDPVVAVEIAARAGLAKCVDTQGKLRDSERPNQEGERVGVAVEHRHHGHLLLVGAHQRLEVGTGLARATIEAVGAGDHEDTRKNAALAERARRLYRLRYDHPGRE